MKQIRRNAGYLRGVRMVNIQESMRDSGMIKNRCPRDSCDALPHQLFELGVSRMPKQMM